MSKLSQLKYLVMPLILGVLFVVAPVILNLFIFLCFLIFEIVFIKKHGLCWLGAKRLSIFFVIVLAAYFAPFKYLDREVNPSTLQFSNIGHLTSLKGESVYIRFPSQYSEKDIKLYSKKISLRSLLKDIEGQTGLKHKIYYCGTGANILFGAHPLLGIQFEESTPNK